MGYLFDTNAFSELFRRRPNGAYVEWLRSVPREDQYTSSIVVAELLAGACSSPTAARWLERYEDDIIRRVTVLPFDLDCARVYGKVRAALRREGTPIGEPDTLIAATALAYGLTVVTANARHFARINGLFLRIFEPGA